MASTTNGHDGGHKPKDTHVDVLVIGAGPAGLMAAACLARMGIKTRIVDKRSTRILAGQADGLQARTLEIFDGMGLLDGLRPKSNGFSELVTWQTGKNGGIERQSTVPGAFTGPDISKMGIFAIHQGFVEQALIDKTKEHSSIEVERNVLPASLTFDESKAGNIDEYPIQVELQHVKEQTSQTNGRAVNKNGHEPISGMFRSNLTLDDTDGLIQGGSSLDSSSRETVYAKYMLGCEGAHSWTRRQLGITMEGDTTDSVFGVVDIIPITDFPDIRKPGTIQSSDHGSILVIPRERKLVRLYIQLNEFSSEPIDRTKVTPEQIIASAQKIFQPYKLEYTHCEWWTAYQIGQRIGSSYSNPSNRIFLAGDAVHTHSPKAGQGMNVSMQDTYNLSWKLAGVIKHGYHPSILDTYEIERKPIAHQLIEFDRLVAAKYSAKPTKEELFAIYWQHRLFVLGTGIRYPPSMLTANYELSEEEYNSTSTTSGSAKAYAAHTSKPIPTPNPSPANPSLVTAAPIGTRMCSPQFLRHADAETTNLHAWLPGDGRWRLLIFPGDISQPSLWSRLNSLGAALTPLLRRYTHRTVSTPVCPVASHPARTFERDTCLLELMVLHCAPRAGVDITAFHETFVPFGGDEGRDYDRVFADAGSTFDGSGGKAYEECGVDKEKGALVLLRPDGYVGWIGEVEDVEGLQRFLDGAGWLVTGVSG